MAHKTSGPPVKLDESCDICNAPALTRPILDVNLAGVFAAHICECDHCGFRQVRPRLSPVELRALYSIDYFDTDTTVGFGDYARQQQRYERQAYFLAKELERITPMGRLLEVGCALGFFLNSLRQYSAWKIMGIDVSEFAAYFAHQQFGLDVRCVTLEDAQFPDNAFDYSLQKDLLEHVLRPRDHLLETRRVLRVGGCLQLITPNGNADFGVIKHMSDTLQRSSKDLLPLLGQIHLSFFSKLHLLRLFSECGFECIRFRNIHIKSGLRALGYLPAMKKTLRAVPAGQSRDELDLSSRIQNVMAVSDDPRTDGLVKKIRRELATHRSRLRSWHPYFYFRRIQEKIGAWPSFATLGVDFGYDFEFLLRKR
ncbi:MAG: methyltransferase domain-containing protein [Gammaproteobacteria bacterium]